MEYFVKSGKPEKQRDGCIIVGVFSRRKPSEAATAIDDASEGVVSSMMRRGDMDGKPGQTVMLHKLPNLFADRVLLVGCGKEKEFDDAAFRKANATAAAALKKTGCVDAISYLTELKVKGRDSRWKVKQAILESESQFYEFKVCKGKSSNNNNSRKLERMTFALPSRAELEAGEIGIRQGEATAEGTHLSKNLGNLPGNICTPSYLAAQAESLAQRFKTVKTKVLEEDDMEALKMGSLLSVSKGSREPAKLIIMEYMQGPKDQKPIALVGKGLTFDAGGISIKPAAAMDEMKYDMCGGAGVLGAMHAAAKMKLPINLIGVVPSSENLPDGAANKPGDIVTSMSGITIEILNTDAEGRLILCDALTYVEQNYDTRAVIDLATLTGACVVALGQHASGLFSNNRKLASQLMEAGELSGDRAWQLPLWEDYQEQLKSPFADVANVGGRDAGAITAASFLHRFTRKLTWAHMDIAGSAWLSGSNKGSTGRPVPLLAEYLISQAESP